MNLRDAYARNLAGLRVLLARAERAYPRKVNGAPIQYWRMKVEEYERLSRASDQELTDHLAAGNRAIAARLAELREGDHKS